MAYVIDPHLAFSDRLSRLLRQRQVPVKGCRVNDVWLAYVAATQAYTLWPVHRTAYRFMFSHEDRQSGPITFLSWIVYFEHVNRLSARTAVSFAKLQLETPLIISLRNDELVLNAKDYPGLIPWLRAVQTNTFVKNVAALDVSWKRTLSAHFLS